MPAIFTFYYVNMEKGEVIPLLLLRFLLHKKQFDSRLNPPFKRRLRMSKHILQYCRIVRINISTQNERTNSISQSHEICYRIHIPANQLESLIGNWWIGRYIATHFERIHCVIILLNHVLLPFYYTFLLLKRLPNETCRRIGFFIHQYYTTINITLQ